MSIEVNKKTPKTRQCVTCMVHYSLVSGVCRFLLYIFDESDRWAWYTMHLGCTGVNPAGDAGDTPPRFWLGGDVNGNIPQYYYVLSDIADQYWLPSVRSASSRFHSANRRHEFASVRQADSLLTRLVPPPTLNSR